MVSDTTGLCKGKPNSPKRCGQKGNTEGVKADIYFLNFGWGLTLSADVRESEKEGHMLVVSGERDRKGQRDKEIEIDIVTELIFILKIVLK